MNLPPPTEQSRGPGIEEEAPGWDLEEGEPIVPGRVALRPLAGGSRYETYLAWDDRLFSIVVVKVLRPDQVEDADALRGLRREAEALARLAHPVIVRAFDAVLEGPRPHLVLEHLEGPNLRSLVKRHGPVALEQLLPLALNICSGLQHMAVEGMVHLDVKPANVVMGAPPRLIDLSIARPVEETALIRAPIGTDAYMAPEQCDPGRRLPPIGPPADVWGLGATLYYGVAGRVPFPRERGASVDGSTNGRFPQLVRDPEPPPGDVPPPVVDVVMACLRKDPRERPSASELALALEPLVGALRHRPVLGWRRR